MRGLVLIHEWWGLNAHIKDVARRYEQAGFNVLPVDLYGGKTAPLSDPEGARSLMQGLQEPQARAQLADAIRSFPERPGVLGFCMGGRLALYAGCEIRGVGAVVDFYGGVNPPFAFDVRKLEAPFLGLFGARDKSIPEAMVMALQHELKAEKKHCELAVYPDAGHAFFNDTRPDVYHPEAAADAFTRSVDFLKKFLK